MEATKQENIFGYFFLLDMQKHITLNIFIEFWTKRCTTTKDILLLILHFVDEIKRRKKLFFFAKINPNVSPLGHDFGDERGRGYY